MRLAQLLRTLLVVAPLVSLATRARAQSGPLGVFEAQTDVGTVHRPGAASYDPKTRRYTIDGSGQNMWGAHDDFHFVWMRLSGDFILTARARFVGTGVEAHRKIGWTLRPDLGTSAPHVTAAAHGNGLMSLQTRRVHDTVTTQVVVDSLTRMATVPTIVQLERRGNVYIMSVAADGDTLVSRQLTDVTLPDTVYAGLFVCAHNDTVTERAVFDNVRITIPPGRDFVAYRDYIGSNLEVMDLATGDREILHTYTGSLQAPNWTHDGRALIYNQDGRLYRFDLATRTPAVINTDFATHQNNDHVLSFDGRMLVVSNAAADDSGRSNVYTVPVGGGVPTRVTTIGPSYAHGWSPNGKTLLFTGQRGGEFDVYAIPAAGGPERRLTTTPGLDDGPEFTPDGRQIYFNSVRSGSMQLWRMKPDGSDPVQVTAEPGNHWFPHVSPDGKWIVYISFPSDVKPDEHPFYQRVYLKRIPVGGGPSRVIAYLYGGQGTINVPSWSPDGRRIAFVSNTTIR